MSTLDTKPSTSDPTSPKNGNADTGSIPPTIPIEHPYRTLVVCFDGTGDQFDTDNSNIIEFFRLLKRDDPDKQLVYYQAGIGTYTIPQIASPFFSKVRKLWDEAVALSLDAHIMGGYEFLMENFRFNDRICIFGFSRGSYTARCLAGMIHKVGLLPRSNVQQVPFAYKMFTRNDQTGWDQSNAFKKTFSNDVDIEFVGVWDTVASVGLIPRRLPFTKSNSVICTFRHAISLDEHRAKFKANLYNRDDKADDLLGITEQQLALHKGKLDAHHHGMSALERKYAKNRATPTDVDEVWFAGVHCDIGGGSVPNGTKPCLARIPLRWMIRECLKTHSGILFNTEGMKDLGLDPATLYPEVRQRPPAITIDPSSPNPKVFIAPIPKRDQTPEEKAQVTAQELNQTEEEIEFADALAPLYDALYSNWWWWILEILPLIHKIQGIDHKWYLWFGCHFGAGRHVPPHPSNGIRVHRSVQTRLDAQYKNGSKYWPKAKFDLKDVTWVD